MWFSSSGASAGCEYRLHDWLSGFRNLPFVGWVITDDVTNLPVHLDVAARSSTLVFTPDSFASFTMVEHHALWVCLIMLTEAADYLRWTRHTAARDERGSGLYAHHELGTTFNDNTPLKYWHGPLDENNLMGSVAPTHLWDQGRLGNILDTPAFQAGTTYTLESRCRELTRTERHHGTSPARPELSFTAYYTTYAFPRLTPTASAQFLETTR